MLRNLFYNCCPIEQSSEVTRDNIEWLCKYGNTFNNRRIVVIKTGEIMEDPDVIRPLFDSLDDVEFILWPNDPILHETAGFLETLGLLESTRRDEATFYAHTKGVSQFSSPTANQVSIRQWRNRMYHECLSRPEEIDEVMKGYAACGCFFQKEKRSKHAWPWHFAGAFWWVNHTRLFRSNWKKIHQSRYGPEQYLSQMFKSHEVSHLYYSSGIAFYDQVFGLFLCNCCGEVNTLIEKPQCPKCKGIDLKFIKNSDMSY